MATAAPNAKDLAAEKKHLTKVATKESPSSPKAADKAPLVKLWNDNKGAFDKIKKEKRFATCKWRKNFAPKTADEFATGVLGGLAFDD
jgi:hypothetical protein